MPDNKIHKNNNFSLRNLFLVFLVLGLISSVFLNIVQKFGKQPQDEFQAKMRPTSIEYDEVGALDFNGAITEDAVANLETKIKAPHDRNITMMSINSPGGDGLAAEKISKLLNKYNIRAIITSASSCNSACVMMYFHTNDHYAQDNAKFTFHQGFYFKTSLANRILSLIGAASDTAPVYMDQIVKEIGAPLVNYMASCKQANPLRTDRGITLKWIEISHILEGKPDQSCDTALRAS